MNEPPTTLLQPKQAGHADGYRSQIGAAADLGSPAFDLDDTCKIVRHIFCNELDTGDLAVAVVRRGAGES